jgi:hypothetical protein
MNALKTLLVAGITAASLLTLSARAMPMAAFRRGPARS